MRVAFVCRDLAHSRLTGPGARAFSTACALSDAGHDVHLISESLAAHRARALAAGHGPQWTRVRDSRPAHRYFTDQHAYSDLVYDTLQRLAENEPFDVVEFSSVNGEALTAVRAKRLLGQFADTALVVRMGAELEVAQGTRREVSLTLENSIDSFARDYVLAHVDALLTDTPPRGIDTALGATRAPIHIAPFVPGPRGVPTLRIPEVGALLTIWHLGELTPESGIDTFLDAAQIVLASEPRARFIVAGDDTPSDPFGRSYWESRHRQLSGALRDAVTFVGPLTDARNPVPMAGNQCVIATATADAAGGVVLAMAHSCAVVVREGSAAAAFVEPDVSATVVPANDAFALATTLLDIIAEPKLAAVLSRGGARRVATHFQPQQMADSIALAYASHVPRNSPAGISPPAADELVSVVIPLFNQGHFLLGAIESVRVAGYPHIEIVVVDDGSTDQETIEIFDRLTGVTKVRQPNAGLSAARNAGIAAASGRYIVPLDSDDLLSEGFLAPAVEALRCNPDLGYVAGYLRYFGLLDYTHVPAGYVPHLSLVVNTHVRATALFKRDALMLIGCYDVDLPAFEDWDLHVRLALAGYTSDILPLEGHRYRRHAESMTFSSSNAMRRELLQYLMRKHLGSIDHAHARDLLILMANLWKTGYEPSASVRLQQEGQQPLVPAEPLM
ncbi:MAG TPA: glycosyltransferase [Acidothermaceae bacterium]|nr:glycosyltransferase [Acidothermaceae bacterium]